MFFNPDFLKKVKNYDDSHTFKADIKLLIFGWIYRTSWPKMGVFFGGGGKIGEGVVR